MTRSELADGMRELAEIAHNEGTESGEIVDAFFGFAVGLAVSTGKPASELRELLGSVYRDMEELHAAPGRPSS